MNHIESKIQQACVTWFRLQYPDTIIAAIPNGGKRGIKTAMAMKREGVLAGMPDLFIASARDGFHGLFIEMKSAKGTTTPEQKIVLEKLRDEGYIVFVCRSFDDFQAIVNNYMGKYF